MFETLVGQESIKETLERMLLSGRIPHTMLFAGPNGVGKSEAAFNLASALLCRESETGCGSCSSCVRAKRFEHPDLHLLFPFRAQPLASGSFNEWMDNLQAHRRLLASESYAPVVYEKGRQIVTGLVDEVHDRLKEGSFEGGKRVCIVLEADSLNDKTGNALLKILEEPPPDVYFVLTTERLSSVLPTITSRSSVFRFRRLQAAEIDEYLALNGVGDAKLRVSVSRQAEGSLKAAKMLAFGDRSGLDDTAAALYLGVAGGTADDVIKGAFALQWSRDVAAAEKMINCFVRLTGDVLHAYSGAGGYSPPVTALAGRTNIRSLNRLAGKFEESYDMLGRNVSISMVMTTLMYEIQDAYR